MFGMTKSAGLGSEFLRAVDAVDWAAYGIPPCPLGYVPERVPLAFRRLSAVSSWEEAAKAYSDMLFAVGNNHAGCLYPAAVPAAPLLARIVGERSGWPLWAAMEILIEFLSFDVDREEFTDPGRWSRRRTRLSGPPWISTTTSNGWARHGPPAGAPCPVGRPTDGRR